LPSNHLFDTDEGEENHREVVFQAGLEGFADETDVVVNLSSEIFNNSATSLYFLFSAMGHPF